jgi:hypothetical protein
VNIIPLNLVPSPLGTCVYVATRRTSLLSTPQQPPPEKPDTQTSSEYIPSQKLPTQRTESPTLRKVTPKKRKSFNVVVPSKSSSSASISRPQSEKRVTPEAAKDYAVPRKEYPEHPRPVKRRKLVRKVIEDSQPEFPKSVPVVEGAPIDVPSPAKASSVVEPVKTVTVEPVKTVTPQPTQTRETPKSQPSQQQESRSRSRSRQVTPSQPLSRNSRHRSLSPVTKVDSWLSFDSDNSDEEIPQTELPADHLHSGTLSQINDPPALEEQGTMNPNSLPPGQTGPNFPPIQAAQFRGYFPPQNIVAGQIVQRRGSGSSRRSVSGSVQSHQSFSSAVLLQERLRGTQDSAAYEQIRAQASYLQKTPTVSSAITSISNFSGNTGISSVSTENLTNLKLVTLGEGESILAVSATALQTRLTRGILINKQTQIQEFCSNAADASEDLIASIKELVENCSRLATHPYMIITPPLANAELPEQREAEYLGSSSGKFVALGRILEALSGDKEVRIGIVVEDVKEMDLLEGFLRGRGVRVRRTDAAGVRGQQLVEGRGGANCTLVISGKAGARSIVVSPTMLNGSVTSRIEWTL